MTDWIAQIDDLTYKLECAQFRLEELERAIGLRHPSPLVFGLTKGQARILGVLMTKKVALKTVIYDVLYSDVVCDKELPEIKVIDVQIWHIRKKLRAFGIVIETVWGSGYTLSLQDKEKINRLLEQEEGKVSA